MRYGPCQFKVWYHAKFSTIPVVSLGQYRLVPAAHTQQQHGCLSRNLPVQHQHKTSKTEQKARQQSEPAKQKQVTGQIRIDTPEINITAQASS